MAASKTRRRSIALLTRRRKSLNLSENRFLACEWNFLLKVARKRHGKIESVFSRFRTGTDIDQMADSLPLLRFIRRKNRGGYLHGLRHPNRSFGVLNCDGAKRVLVEERLRIGRRHDGQTGRRFCQGCGKITGEIFADNDRWIARVNEVEYDDCTLSTIRRSLGEGGGGGFDRLIFCGEASRTGEEKENNQKNPSETAPGDNGAVNPWRFPAEIRGRHGQREIKNARRERGRRGRRRRLWLRR